MGWLSETGRVVAVEPDAVWIEADRSAACGKCAARAGCGQGALSALLQSGKGRVRATSGETLTAAQCAVGDEVVIQVPEATLSGRYLTDIRFSACGRRYPVNIGVEPWRSVVCRCLCDRTVIRLCYPSVRHCAIGRRATGALRAEAEQQAVQPV